MLSAVLSCSSLFLASLKTLEPACISSPSELPMTKTNLMEGKKRKRESAKEGVKQFLHEVCSESEGRVMRHCCGPSCRFGVRQHSVSIIEAHGMGKGPESAEEAHDGSGLSPKSQGQQGCSSPV